MTLELWLAFAAASAIMLSIPGPTVMLVVSYALGRGARSGLATVPGVTLGDFMAMSISLAGAGAVLATSATLFTLLKLAGAVYLIWLGIKLWRAAPGMALPQMGAAEADRSELRAMFFNSFVVTALNPKSIVFFVAFVPQFIDPAAPLLPQIVILEATFLTLAAVNIALWALLAGEMRRRLGRPSVLRLLGRAGGGALMAAGLFTALAGRPASS
ncbi:MAG: LysE family translocator [Pseudomonadota bacterium]